jgi:hypothetical protein
MVQTLLRSLMVVVAVSVFCPSRARADLPLNSPSDPSANVGIEDKKLGTAAALGGIVGFGLGHYYAKSHWTAPSTIYAAIDTVLVLTVMTLVPIAGNQYGGFAQVFLYGFGTALFVERTKQAYDAYNTALAFNTEIHHHIDPPRGDSLGMNVRFPLLTIPF